MLLSLIVVALAWSYLGKRKGSENSGQSALDMLKERYAKGEINEEYEEKKKIFKLTY